MRLLFTCLFLAAAATCLAQKQDVYFVKDDGSFVAHRDSANFIRIIKEPAPGSDYFGLTEYYLPSTFH